MALWKHDYTEPPIDLRAYSNSNPEVDWQVAIDVAIHEFASGALAIAKALDEGGEKAAYIRANARQFGDKLPLELVCSVWLTMEGLQAAE